MRFACHVIACAIVGCSFNEVKPVPPHPSDPGCGTVGDPPDASAASSTTKVTYAVDSIFLGDVARGAGFPTTTAWKDFGFDVDGLISDAKSVDVCVRAPGAPSSVQADGYCGKDNSFGANILPILQSVGSLPNPSVTSTALIQEGASTLEIQVDGLDTGIAMQTSLGLAVQTFVGAQFDPSTKPSFDPSDDWPVRSDLHPDPKTGDPFDVAYITKGVVIARGATMRFSVVLSPAARIDLVIHGAILAMTVRGDEVMAGTIAGALETSAVISTLQRVGGDLSKSLCGNAFDARTS